MSMEPTRVRLRTYQKVWVQERVLYQIERVRLPFPISFTQMGVFGAALIAMAVLARLVPSLTAASPVLRYLVIPAAAAWVLTRQRLDGKPLHRWFITMIQYAAGPKQLNRLRPMERTPGRLRPRATVGYRVKG
ncbi:MAG TPA: conjugal transfer protein [Symbiobacteriaceae bacterium]|nr:conjugal transfer protein [Symbiobacteriaceae bacterium]